MYTSLNKTFANLFANSFFDVWKRFFCKYLVVNLRLRLKTIHQLAELTLVKIVANSKKNSREN